MPPRNLILVLGDQLDARSAAFDGFDRAQDAVLQMEVREEAENPPQNRVRLVFFFAAMRHFRDALREDGVTVLYSAIDDAKNAGSFAGEIRRVVRAARPKRLIVLEPGDYRVRENLVATARALRLPMEIREDRHFLCDAAQFAEFADHAAPMLMENFYRGMRRRLGILVDEGRPAGGAWNYDSENRAKLPRVGGPAISLPRRFAPDEVTREVIGTVARLYPDAPGVLDDFTLPVTRAQALALLDDFVEQRLPHFGRYQDAMRAGQPFLFHSLLSGPLNLHMLTPREVVDRVLAAYAAGAAPLNAVEGFVRQVIGWREYMRGVYWRMMPDLAGANALGAELPVPRFFWTGQTEMRCVRHAVRQLAEHAYAHHIQRLMVLGQLMLLLGVRPYDAHRWHMSMFWDAVDWVSLPNVVGMSQHADGGRIATKPYAASGAYINRMSDYCGKCRYDPRQAVGETACPFTTLYWDFLARHRPRLARNHRMGTMLRNLDGKAADLPAIRARAAALKAEMTRETFL